MKIAAEIISTAFHFKNLPVKDPIESIPKFRDLFDINKNLCFQFFKFFHCFY